MEIPVLRNDGDGLSMWTMESLELTDVSGMWISDRQEVLNFRHRESAPGYRADWHVAGDPTLIIVRSGRLAIGLRDGSWREFGAGVQFVAADFLAEGTVFDTKVHGHTAKVVGEDRLLAVHIKLGKV